MSDLTQGLAYYPRNIPEPKNEEAICSNVVRFMSVRRGEPFVDVCQPDKEDQSQQNVELVVESPSGHRAVIEHTRIESYPDQIPDGRAFVILLRPLEGALPRFLPDGKYDLTIECGAASKVRGRDADQVRLAIAIWVVNAASKLAEGSRVTERPQNVRLRSPWLVGTEVVGPHAY